MLFILCPLRSCQHSISCSSVQRLSVIMYSGFSRQKSTKIGCVEEPAQIVKGGHKQVDATSLIAPFPAEKSVACEIEKDPCKIEKSEYTPIIVDYTKLHKHYLKLSKIKLTCTGLVSATANTINQFFEVPFDAQMSRTKNRVLVRGHLTPLHAIAFATVSGIVGLSLLYHEVNGITAMLGASNLILYTLIYTPMKRISIVNTWIGSIVGAIPPLMGWAGCCGNILTPGAWILPSILYAWQFPHFNALSWNLRPDYSRAGYRMMAVTNPDLCRRTTVRYTVVLMALCYLAPVFNVTHWWFALASMPINASFLYLAWKFNNHSDSANSRRLFRFSLLHLPLLMMLIFSSKKYWANTDKQGDKVESPHNESAKNDLLTIFTAAPIATATSSV